MAGKHTACPECGEPSTHGRICGLCETEDAVWGDVMKCVSTHQRNENLAVWVIPSTGQFSFSQQDERYWTKMIPHKLYQSMEMERQNALDALSRMLVVHEDRGVEDARSIAVAMAKHGATAQGTSGVV